MDMLTLWRPMLTKLTSPPYPNSPNLFMFQLGVMLNHNTIGPEKSHPRLSLSLQSSFPALVWWGEGSPSRTFVWTVIFSCFFWNGVFFFPSGIQSSWYMESVRIPATVNTVSAIKLIYFCLSVIQELCQILMVIIVPEKEKQIEHCLLEVCPRFLLNTHDQA